MNLQAGLAWGAVTAVIAGSIASFWALRQRVSPRDRERRRREFVHQSGRVIEGYVTSVEESTIYYSYHWRGVRYEASQDVSDFAGTLAHCDDFAGPVTVKFLGSRPSNSIVISDNWSGIPKVRK